MIERMDGGAVTGTSGAVGAPTVGWASGPLGEVQAAAREISRLTAVRARAVAAFAASRPASVDRQQGERGAMSAERWAARPEVLRPVSQLSDEDWDVVAGQEDVGGQTAFELEEPVSTRYVLVYLTSLPREGSGYRGGIAEVGVW